MVKPLDHPSLVLGRGPTDYRMVEGVQTCVAGIRFKSAMLAARDKAFLDTNLLDVQRARSFQNSLRIVKHIDARLSANWGKAIYSDELASELRISVRTMHTAMLKIRGMSLHRYLRLRRLWAVRRLLLAGNKPLQIKACALSNGFWHMGEFAALYAAQFGGAPSMTLARARQQLR
jgi:AraC family transcriptional regulator, ethanolamine operon transcriptional activator